MGVRAEKKRESREAIVEVAGRLCRERGLGGAGVAAIMNDAGLTHGGFYVHFESRRELLLEMLRRTFETTRRWYFRGLSGYTGRDWVRAAVGRYLTARHRDSPETGCVIAGLAGDVAREDQDLRMVFEQGLEKIVAEYRTHLEEAGDNDAEDRALALVTLCAGGVLLSRAVADRRLSNRILRACQRLADRDLRPRGGKP